MNKIKNLLIIIGLLIYNFSFSQEGVITIDSSQDIKNLVNKKITHNSSSKAKKGYRIQLFYGSENGAINTQNRFRELFPNTSCALEFDSPNWKVKVGNYKTRLIADKHLQEIITKFGDAIVIEPKKK
jgi:hypothetical protein